MKTKVTLIIMTVMSDQKPLTTDHSVVTQWSLNVPTHWSLLSNTLPP